MHASKEELLPVYYIYGPEDYLADEALSSIKKAALSGGFESLNYHVYDGMALDAADVVSTALTLPAFSEKRLVVIKGAEAIKAKETELLVAYVKKPSPSTCLVFVANAAKVDQYSELIKPISAGGGLKNCARLKDDGLRDWIKKEAKRQGKSIKDSTAARLVSITGTSLRDLKGELDKIILYIGERPSVEDSDVDALGLDLKEENIFGLSDAIGSKDVKRAMRIYSKISSEEPTTIIGAIARQMRVLLMLKSLLEKGTPPRKAVASLGVPPYYADSYARRCRLFTASELKKALKELARADMALKTGRLPGEIILSKLIMDLSARA